MDPDTKQQLIDKSKELLTKARYLSADEIFMLDSALNAPEIEDDSLQEIHDSLAEYNHELNAAYQDFKKEMSDAIADYTKKLADAKKETNQSPSDQPQTENP